MSPPEFTPREEAALETTGAKRLAELAQDPRLAAVVAANPAAPPDLLEHLFRGAEPAVCQALVSNPSTPPVLLVKLGCQYPEQLLKNPAFEQLLLEQPNLLTELPKNTLHSLLEREVLPQGLIRWVAQQGDESALLALLVNPQVPAEVISQLQQHASSSVREAAALHVNVDISRDPPRQPSVSDSNEELLALLNGPFKRLRDDNHVDPDSLLVWDSRRTPVIQAVGYLELLQRYPCEKSSDSRWSPVDYVEILQEKAKLLQMSRLAHEITDENADLTAPCGTVVLIISHTFGEPHRWVSVRALIEIINP